MPSHSYPMYPMPFPLSVYQADVIDRLCRFSSARITTLRGSPRVKGQFQRQCGAAIISALMVVAIAAALSATMTVQVSRWLDTVANERRSVQATSILRAALDWTGIILEQDARTSTSDHLNEAWAQTLPPIPLDQEGDLQGRITDACANFNLNNLIAEDGNIDMRWLKAYRRLLETLGLPGDLALILADWLDRNSVTVSGEPERWGDRLLPANRPLRMPGEIAVLPGYSPAVIERLKPYITALPERSAVNVNTASAEVLNALVDGDSSNIGALIVERQRLPFRDMADLQSRLTNSHIQVENQLMDVSSRWFIVTGKVRFRHGVLYLEALIHRTGGRSQLVWWITRE